MNTPKRPLRSALEELASSFADAVIAAARDAIFERHPSQPFFEPQARAAEPRRERARAPKAAKEVKPPTASPAPARTPDVVKPPRAARVARESAGTATASDQLITDPQALLTALDTANAPAVWEVKEAPVRRLAPAILSPVTSPTPVAPAPEVARFQDFAPVLREGEVIVRRSAAGVVLRRRRG